MPDFGIVDTHLHLWDPERLSYPWIHEIGPALEQRFLLEEFDAARGDIDVEKIVFVECDCAVEQKGDEVEFITELAKQEPRIQGIVVSVPLEQGGGTGWLLEKLADNPLIRGIRRLIEPVADIGFCLQPNFVEGIRLLPAHNFSFDICIKHHQLEDVIQLVAQCPDTFFVLDHIAKPAIAKQEFDPWRQALQELSEMDNVVCKISGMVTEADHGNWTREDLKPYIDHVLECFGFDRVMYGGDWPVSTLATDYVTWVETLEWAVGGCSDDEKRQLFRDNAVTHYRL